MKADTQFIGALLCFTNANLCDGLLGVAWAFVGCIGMFMALKNKNYL